MHGPTSADDDHEGKPCDGVLGEDGRDTTTVRGRRAEDVARRYLERAGLELVTRN